uniref:Putative ovule protein n=1 Tax=Solanum chacoense TaxID=4108 RepID=A0A0V0GVK4_SOLCH
MGLIANASLWVEIVNTKEKTHRNATLWAAIAKVKVTCTRNQKTSSSNSRLMSPKGPSRIVRGPIKIN